MSDVLDRLQTMADTQNPEQFLDREELLELNEIKQGRIEEIECKWAEQGKLIIRRDNQIARLKKIIEELRFRMEGLEK